MKKQSLLTAVGLSGLLLGVAVAAQAAVEVKFVEPEKFADVGESGRDRENNLSELEAHLRDLAGKRLPASQRLLIEVLDVDLAGQVEPKGRYMERIRIVKDIGWPAMELRYVLSEGDKTLREGQVRLSDMNFLHSNLGLRHSGEALRYEKQMLDDWFAKEFAASKP